MVVQIEVNTVAEAMQKYGGSFVKYLGELLRRADPINQQKIKDTWPEYWNKYLKIGSGKSE